MNNRMPVQSGVREVPSFGYQYDGKHLVLTSQRWKEVRLFPDRRAKYWGLDLATMQLGTHLYCQLHLHQETGKRAFLLFHFAPSKHAFVVTAVEEGDKMYEFLMDQQKIWQHKQTGPKI